jgi:hypothetical protein
MGAVERLGSAACSGHRLRSDTDHKLRAALICLLTAALAAKGTAAIMAKLKAAGSGSHRGYSASLGDKRA